jgi:hypothetical protein
MVLQGCLVLYFTSISQVFHKCSSMPHDTALQAHRKLRPSKGLLGGHAQHVITQLA